MVGSFYNGISGIRTHQFGIDSTSNNIANVNTVGYRGNLPEFKSLFATSMDYVNANSPISNDYNYGVTIGSNAINANDGAYTSAEGDFNVAYSGKGWFVVGLNKEGAFDLKGAIPFYNGIQQNYFTRDGSFSLDGEGYLVNSSGYYMYGVNLGKIAADGTMTGTNNLQADYAGLSGSNLQPIQIPKELTYKPTLTTEVGLSINLNRTQNPKGIGIIQDEKGAFSMEKFLAQDLNALMNEKGELIDPKNYKDMTITLERGGVKTSYTFTYGGEENGFKTMGELMELVRGQTGLNLELKLDSKGEPTDCTLCLSNAGMQDVRVSINGRLADKLGMKASNNNLESAFGGILKEFADNITYQDKDYIKYNGMIFQKKGDGVAGNPLDNPDDWTLVDTSGVAAYQSTKVIEYKKDAFIVSEGKVYRKLSDEGVVKIANPITGAVTIANPADDTANWQEVGNNVEGAYKNFADNTQYQDKDYVKYQGMIFQKNGTGVANGNPLDNRNGWTLVDTSGVAAYQSEQAKGYAKDALIVSDGKVYKKLTDAGVVTEITNADTGEVTIANPADDTANWQEVGDYVEGGYENFADNTEYKDQDYVKYQGMIFQKKGDGVANGNPLDNPDEWELVDTSGVAAYQSNQAGEYAKDTFIVSEGKVYKKLTDTGIVKITNAGGATIVNPADDTANWQEVGDSVLGKLDNYVEGTTYPQDSIVIHNGILYRKKNGEGNTNPAEDTSGWGVLGVSIISSTKLQMPTYETNTEVFNDSGEKFILKSQYVLVEQADRNVTPEVLERWEVRSAIYDSMGKVMLSENLIINEITFNNDGSANAPVFEVPFENGTISVDLTKSADGKTSSNFAYADSAIKSVTQDGTEVGIMKDFVIDENGIIMVNFSNGKLEPIGRFGIAAFVNDQGLSKVGSNLFQMNVRRVNGETAVVSGPPVLAWEEGGLARLKFGKVMDHMLETSNVDTGTALTDLIVYQRGYQMSAKSITTADQLMQEAIQLKRN